MSEPKVIFFDWNKTLSNSLFWSHMSPDTGHKYSLYHSKLITTLFVENKNLINPWMRGEYTTDEIKEMSANGYIGNSEISRMLQMQAVPKNFYELEYSDFLKQRRSLMTKAVQDYFNNL